MGAYTRLSASFSRVRHLDKCRKMVARDTLKAENTMVTERRRFLQEQLQAKLKELKEAEKETSEEMRR